MDASKIFPNTEIKGGVAITYHDESRDFGAIGVFTPFDELNAIIKKTQKHTKNASLSDIGVTSSAYHFTEKLHTDHPDLKSRTITVNGKEGRHIHRRRDRHASSRSIKENHAQ